MSASKVAKRYSKALLSLCNKDDSHQLVAADLEKFCASLRENETVAFALTDPAIDSDLRGRVLEKIVADLSIKAVCANFLYFVGEKQRMGEIEGIVSDFNERLDALAGRVRASVVSATALSVDEEKKIKASLEKSTGKTVILESSVDPSLLGGVVARVGNLVLDGSIKTALGSMREQLLESVH